MVTHHKLNVFILSGLHFSHLNQHDNQELGVFFFFFASLKPFVIFVIKTKVQNNNVLDLILFIAYVNLYHFIARIDMVFFLCCRSH